MLSITGLLLICLQILRAQNMSKIGYFRRTDDSFVSIEPNALLPSTQYDIAQINVMLFFRLTIHENIVNDRSQKFKAFKCLITFALKLILATNKTKW